MKTNAARMLDALHIKYELRDYEVDPDHLEAEVVAAKIGMDPARVFKTLVAKGDRTGALFAVVPGDAALDLKAIAKLSGDRAVETVALKEVQPLTGYIRGGVTVLGAKKAFPVFADASLVTHATVAVSAGIRGTQIVLDPKEYVRAVKAKLGPIARAKSTAE